MSLLSLRDLSGALFTYLGRTAFFKAFGQNWGQCDVSGLVLPALWCIVSDKSRPPEGIRFCLVSTRTNLLLLSHMLIYFPELGNTCAKPHYKFSSGKMALSSLQSEVFCGVSAIRWLHNCTYCWSWIDFWPRWGLGLLEAWRNFLPLPYLFWRGACRLKNTCSNKAPPMWSHRKNG